MSDISVIVCTHNPRLDQLRRTVGSLAAQTLSRREWELLLVDNASDERVETSADLSWHPRARYVREDELGLTAARMRGVKEASGALLVFVDDDNVLAPNFLAEALRILAAFPYLGAFGAGRLEPEFEVAPPPEILPRVRLLAIRSVESARWSNNPADHGIIPWGAGLCVRRRVAESYRDVVSTHDVSATLDRKGRHLFAGGDDLFSWVASARGEGFGIFPQLRVTHLIGADRLTQSYFLRLIHDHAFSQGILQFGMAGTRPRRIDAFRCAHLAIHGLRNGWFALRCQWAESLGEHRAARFIAERAMMPSELSERIRS